MINFWYTLISGAVPPTTDRGKDFSRPCPFNDNALWWRAFFTVRSGWECSSYYPEIIKSNIMCKEQWYEITKNSNAVQKSDDNADIILIVIWWRQTKLRLLIISIKISIKKNESLIEIAHPPILEITGGISSQSPQ